MSMKLIFAMLAAVATGLRIPAFAPAHAVRVAHPLMTGVSSLAAACLEEECSVDTVQSLVAELTIEAERLSREGTKTSKEQVEALLMLGRLQALSQNRAANQGEIEKIVSGMARSFGTVKDYDFPGSALGYTGTPNKNKVGLD